MKNLKSFDNFINEAYDEKEHSKINLVRNLTNTKMMHRIAKFLSIIDDLKRLDFKALKHSFKNKSGYNKLEKIIFELGILKQLKTNDDTLSFQDLYRYNFNSEMILQYLKDDDVLEYFENDSNSKKIMNQMNDLISFVQEYQDWKDSLMKGMK